MKTKNFYCSICSAGFTRRGSGKGIMIHFTGATGIYGPADTYSFRRNRIQGNSIGKAQENKTFDFRDSGKYVVQSDHQNRTRMYETYRPSRKSYNDFVENEKNERFVSNGGWDGYPGCPDTKTASSPGSSFLLERSFKVCEVHGLLKKHWPPSELQAMLVFASCLYINQNDELLDYMLNCLRHVDIIKSDHQRVTRTHLPL